MVFEKEYKELLKDILVTGEIRETRNGQTKALFGKTLQINLGNEVEDFIPLLNSRKIYYKGIFGEFAGFMHNVKSVKEFESFGCNYWKLWADGDILDLDYSEQLYNFNGVNQMEMLIDGLQNDPYSRRHMISLWRPDRLKTISLPCCHYSYQFNVTAGGRLDMIWNQRSVDMMIGLPSDIILAYLWVKLLSNMLLLKPGIITMNFGDCHIYEEHIDNAHEYIDKIRPSLVPLARVKHRVDIRNFMPDDIVVYQYEPLNILKFKLKS